MSGQFSTTQRQMNAQDVIVALGYTPADAIPASAGVGTFNGRSGMVLLGSADVSGALAYSPVSALTATNLTVSLGSVTLSSTGALSPVVNVASISSSATLTVPSVGAWLLTGSAGLGGGTLIVKNGGTATASIAAGAPQWVVANGTAGVTAAVSSLAGMSATFTANVGATGTLGSGTYEISNYMPWAGTVSLIAVSGNCSTANTVGVVLVIGTTDVTGAAGTLAASGTVETFTATGNNAFSVGSQITVVVTAAGTVTPPPTITMLAIHG